MKISFNWYKFSFVLGIHKKGIGKATYTGGNDAGKGNFSQEKNNVHGLSPPEVGVLHAEYPSVAGHYMRIGGSSSYQLEASETDTLIQLSNTAILEVQEGIRKIGLKHLGKKELLSSLQCLLKPYVALAHIRALAFRIAINNVIERDSLTYCSIQLNNEDLQGLWREVG